MMVVARITLRRFMFMFPFRIGHSPSTRINARRCGYPFTSTSDNSGAARPKWPSAKWSTLNNAGVDQVYVDVHA
jgi:hypothetical protein